MFQGNGFVRSGLSHVSLGIPGTIGRSMASTFSHSLTILAGLALLGWFLGLDTEAAQ